MLPKHEIKILYLDDEAHNLAAFKANFRRDFEIYTAQTSNEAFALLEKINVHLILADFKMPVFTGVDFFERLIEKEHLAIRILITANAHAQILADAINKGHIHRFVQKPWDSQHLKGILEACFDYYKTNIKLTQLNAELKKRNQELSRFVYSTSHELRSPLMSILGLLELARKGADINYLDLIEQSVRKTDACITAIMEYHQNIHLQSDIELLSFTALVNQILVELPEKKVDIHFELHIDEKLKFCGDIFRVKLILKNLISNAIKYQRQDSDKKIVTITILVYNSHAQINIADNGIGIIKENLDNIFKLFFKARNSNNQIGAGLGLYIVKEAIEQIGGHITVVSENNIGTTFNLIIPNKYDQK
jgi:signal transduction histidine kinase